MLPKKSFKIIIIIISIIFISSYLIADSGYYEYTIQKQTAITNDKIKEFEEDIKNQVDIDSKDYLNKDKINYTNIFSNLFYDISTNSNKITRNIIKKIFKKISGLIEE